MKWIKRGLIGVATLILLMLVVIYAGSEYIMRENFVPEQRGLVMSEPASVLAEGERLATLYGCYRGCHGRHMEGIVAFDEKPFVRAFAPSLTDAVRKYSTQEIEAVIRQGVRPDGHSVWMMPSGSFATMTDEQLSAILSFIKSYPGHEGEPGLPASRFYLAGRLFMMLGFVKSPASLAAEQQPASQASLKDRSKHGEYLAANACSECHGMQLEGQEGFTPPLLVAKAYSREQFKKLMAEGVGVGDRDLGLMSEVAKIRFSQFKAEEVGVLYDYLQSR